MRNLLLALLLASSTAHAAPKHDSAALTHAKAELVTAKARVKAAKAADRAHANVGKRAKKIAALKAKLAKLEHPEHDPGLNLGCGTCTDNHDGSCTCPNVETDPADY